MKKNVLMRTNLLVCIIILVGFVITAFISYHSNRGAFEKDVEKVSTLTAEGITHQIDTIFTKPVNISLTMANDSLLKEFLAEEEEHLEDEAFIQTMRNYLDTYRAKYDYDSVFLVSARTNRYYHFNGLDRILNPDNDENVWYYNFMDSDEEYSLNIDNDEAADNEVTVFINCKIEDTDQGLMGVVGVGFRVDSLQELLRSYGEKFDVKAYLVNPYGIIEIADDKTGYRAENLFAECDFAQLKDQILSNREDAQDFWYTAPGGGGYLVTQYIESLNWFLVIDHDTSTLNQQLKYQFASSVFVVLLVIGFVLFTITNIIRKYNKQIIQLTVDKENEHKTIFQTAAEQFYENIYEIDVTHNRPASEATEQYFESLGAPKGTPFDKALQMVAQKQIKEEFRQSYLDAYSPDKILKAYEEGIENMRHDFMLTNDGHNYYWIRINAHIFFWEEDNSVRMLIYRQNIDEEKRRELFMLEEMQKDSLTDLFNKAATQQHVRSILQKEPEALFAFIILDIDNFKSVNDRFGHAAGDKVLVEFAQTLREQFRDGDVMGRIGGDEFVVFMKIPNKEILEKKLRGLTDSLHRNITIDAGECEISASIGAAVAPEAGNDFETLYKKADKALYATKKRGKNGFKIEI